MSESTELQTTSEDEVKISSKTGKPINKALSNNVRKRFKTVEALETALNVYFDSCEDDKHNQIKPYSVARLALHLNMSRRVFLRYSNGEADYVATELDEDGEKHRVNISFTETMQRALTQIEAYNEECLFTSRNTDGPKFALKNNHRWRDAVDISGENGGPIRLATITKEMTDEEAMALYTDNIKASQQ